MRLFIALHLTPVLLEPVRRLQTVLRAADARSQIRWVEPAGMHLTLKFLGETEPGQVSAIAASLEAALAGRPAPSLSLGEVGGFPSLRQPRVLWLGLQEEGSTLPPLQAAVEEATEKLGWERERRPFQPHLTLGRRRETPDRRPEPLSEGLRRALEQQSVSRPAPSPQRRIALVQSHLEPGGARYEDLSFWELAAPPGQP